MADVDRRTVDQHAIRVREGTPEERAKLAGAVVDDSEGLRGATGVGDAIGGIGPYPLRSLVPEEPLDVVLISCVSADETVIAKVPNVAGLRDGLSGNWCRTVDVVG